MAKIPAVPRATPTIDVVVQSASWRELPDAETIVREAIAAAAAFCDALPLDCEVAVVLTDDEEIRALNKEWRGIDRATNVLSFPASDTAAPADAPQVLGDIVIAYDYLAREAALEEKAVPAHLSHLAVHGFLHLVGYDHMTDDEAELMEGLETRILATLGLPDPYANSDRLRAIHPR
jgi:probable rRNA maturation factor